MVTIPEGYVGFILFFVFIFIIILPLVSFFIAKKITDNSDKIKNSKEKIQFFNELFSFQNFPVAVIFTVFTPAVVFFTLWSVSFLEFGWKLFLIVLLYAFIQLSILVYVLCKGGFEWKK